MQLHWRGIPKDVILIVSIIIILTIIIIIHSRFSSKLMLGPPAARNRSHSYPRYPLASPSKLESFGDCLIAPRSQNLRLTNSCGEFLGHLDPPKGGHGDGPTTANPEQEQPKQSC